MGSLWCSSEASSCGVAFCWAAGRSTAGASDMCGAAMVWRRLADPSAFLFILQGAWLYIPLHALEAGIRPGAEGEAIDQGPKQVSLGAQPKAGGPSAEHEPHIANSGSQTPIAPSRFTRSHRAPHRRPRWRTRRRDGRAVGFRFLAGDAPEG